MASSAIIGKGLFSNNQNASSKFSFAKGADISWITEMESSGKKFYDSTNTQKEILSILKGHSKQAFRRFKKTGVMAHLEGEYFKTYYFSRSQIVNALGAHFKLIKSEGLCALSPPPSQVNFPKKYPTLYQSLRKIDSTVRHNFPFNRWADHIIVTFKYFVPSTSSGV